MKGDILEIYETRKFIENSKERETSIRLIGLEKFIVDDLSEVMGNDNIKIMDLGKNNYAVEFAYSKFDTRDMKNSIWICKNDGKNSLIYLIYKYWFTQNQ